MLNQFIFIKEQKKKSLIVFKVEDKSLNQRTEMFYSCEYEVHSSIFFLYESGEILFWNDKVIS